jgi:hypothetical protein
VVDRLGDVAEGGHAQIDGRGGAARGRDLELGELVVGGVEADLEALDLAELALFLGFGDAGDEVVADLGQAGELARLWPQ